jgi:hypothetical protein
MEHLRRAAGRGDAGPEATGVGKVGLYEYF